jgi:predicted amino acid dehydrogenase
VTPRFAFVVHALSPAHRRVMGLRWATMRLALGMDEGVSPWKMGRICDLGLPGIADGVILGITLDPEQMLADQERAVLRMERVVRLALEEGPLAAVGLGSLCAVVGGRGEALAERLPVPVTTGGAATAWALAVNTLRVVEALGTAGPVAVVGASSPVGRAVAAYLADAGLGVRVDGKRAGKGLAVEVCEGPEEAVAGAPVVVGAGPTGGVLAPEALAPGAVLVDVALPATLTGPPPPGVQVLAGEAIALPPNWARGGWGHAYHLFAGYGPTQVFACVIEPLVLAATGRGAPYALGRKLELSAVRDFGRAAEALGFVPRLAEGWRGIEPSRVAQPRPASGLRGLVSARLQRR